jgi:sugar (pentulose or hexulose) kinase
MRDLIQPYYSRHPGWAEQDCEYFWTRFCEACRDLWQTRPELKARVAATFLTAQRGVTGCLDEEHRPLRPAISWLDQRRTGRVCDAVAAQVG